MDEPVKELGSPGKGTDSGESTAESAKSIVDAFLTQVEDLMAQQGITRADLARRLGCSGANVTRLFRRSSNPTVKTMIDVASAVGCRVSGPVLVGREAPKSEPEKQPDLPEDFGEEPSQSD